MNKESIKRLLSLLQVRSSRESRKRQLKHRIGGLAESCETRTLMSADTAALAADRTAMAAETAADEKPVEQREEEIFGTSERATEVPGENHQPSEQSDADQVDRGSELLSDPEAAIETAPDRDSELATDGETLENPQHDSENLDQFFSELITDDLLMPASSGFSLTASDNGAAEMEAELGEIDFSGNRSAFTHWYLRSVANSSFEGANTSDLAETMKDFAGNLRNASPSLLRRLADIRGRSLAAITAEYQRFLAAVEVRDRKASSAGDFRIESLEGINASFWGSLSQMRYGKVVGDRLGFDPVFGALLNPTGGLIGPGNSALDGSSLFLPVFNYHAIVHDAAGHLYNYFDNGPGYDYLRLEVADPGNPMAGQVTGIIYWLLSHADPIKTSGTIWDVVTNNVVRVAQVLYHTMDMGVGDTAGVLYNELGVGLNQVATALFHVSDKISDVASGLWKCCEGNLTQFAKALRSADVRVGDIARQIWLRTSDLNSLAKALGAAKFGVGDIATQIWQRTNNLNSLAKALRSINTGVSDIATQLWRRTSNLNSLAQALRSAKVGVGDIATQIWRRTNSLNSLAKALRSIDTGVSDIATQVWRRTSNLNSLAQALRSADAGVGEVATQIWHRTSNLNGLRSALQSAGFSASSIASEIARRTPKIQLPAIKWPKLSW